MAETILTLIPVSYSKMSTNGLIKCSLRAVYRFTSSSTGAFEQPVIISAGIIANKYIICLFIANKNDYHYYLVYVEFQGNLDL